MACPFHGANKTSFTPTLRKVRPEGDRPDLCVTYLVRQDQAQLQRTIGNIGITSSSDSGSGSEGGSGGGEEHDRQVVSTSFNDTVRTSDP
jgi:hypothetical protein